MAGANATRPSFLKEPVKKILTRAIFAMGILCLAYVILWPTLPGGMLLFRTFPWFALGAVGLAATEWIVRRWIQQQRQSEAGADRDSATGHRFSLSNTLPPSFPTKPVKEILADTILGLGVVFIGIAAVSPLMGDPVVGPSPWFPLVFLGLVATRWSVKRWLEKRSEAARPANPRLS